MAAATGMVETKEPFVAPVFDLDDSKLYRRHVGEWSYANKAIMAPMVRISTLPMRLLAYHYGADICYSEEMIDRKIGKCVRRVDPITGRIEFHLPAGGLAFSTYEAEPVVMQIGTSDSVLALKAANVVAQDVRAIDINMGCPKHFSLQGGMGAALLTKPELVHDIISTLTRNLSIPVTCKIRLLENPEDTIRLIKAAESAGVSAIAIHARHISDRPRNPARVSLVPAVVSQLTVPAIYNGDVFYHDDIARMKKATGASSAMIARGAQWNASVFRSAGMLPVYDVCRTYMTIAERVGNVFANSKYSVMEMLKGHAGPLPLYQHVCNSRTYTQLSQTVTSLSHVASCITSSYVAPLDASLATESQRRRHADGKDNNTDTSYSDAASGASSATNTSSSTAAAASSTPSGGGRKRRRHKQKDKKANRLHTKYLRATPSAATTETASSSSTNNTLPNDSNAAPTIPVVAIATGGMT